MQWCYHQSHILEEVSELTEANGVCHFIYINTVLGLVDAKAAVQGVLLYSSFQ